MKKTKVFFFIVSFSFLILSLSPVQSQIFNLNNIFVKVTKNTLPAVVNISCWKKKQEKGSTEKGAKIQWESIGEGSGVIVSPKGFIVTNAHVLARGERFRITLADGREFVNIPIGPQNSSFLADKNTDIAIIKVGLKKSERLPSIKLGNSDDLRVGEWVIAVGNPFGLRQTVTAGIVSAKSRVNVGFADYENFIQTDAAINPGNSGGALVNLKGELVGINTAIKTISGGYQGVSFAIPINMVKNISKMLLKYGKIVRGWMGFYTRNRPITNNFEKDKVEVISVLQYSPAYHAGLKENDIILNFNGHPIRSYMQLRSLIATSEVGENIRINVMRNGKNVELIVVVGERPATERFRYLRQKAIDLLGLDIQSLPGKRGVKVIFIKDGSKAQKSGILADDVLIEINKKEIRDRSDFHNAINDISTNEKIRIMISRKGRLFLYLLKADKPNRIIRQ